MSLKSIVTGLPLTLCLAAAPALAGSEPCVSEKDERAFNTRVLQTELMVAALSCNEQQRYNAFVTKLPRSPRGTRASLRAWFNRTYGSASASELNAFVTRLANDASKRSLEAGSYCAAASALLAEVLETPADGFDGITQSAVIHGRHGFSRCN
jgi:hypothetical protein